MRALVTMPVLAVLATTALAADTGVDIEMTGELTVVQACDFEHHKAEILYLLHDLNTGQTFHLRVPQEMPVGGLQTGAKVRVKGRVEASEVTLAANGEGIQTLEAVAAAVTGVQRTVLIVLNFSDAVNSCSVSSVSNLMFAATNSVDGLYQETSFGSIWFTGNVVGPFTINFNSAGACNPDGWATAADAAATAAGVNLGQYQRRIYVLPKANSCSWAGLGTIGGNPSRTWIGICDIADIYAHELGHNLGMQHSSTDTNNDGVLDCEYCDTSDIMGYSGVGLRALNAPHKEQMGWVSNITPLTSESTVNVAPLELASANTPYPQVIKVAKAGTADYYYFSYRRGLGYDAQTPANYLNRSSIHHYDGAAGHTYLISALADNGTFADAASGLVVKQLAHNNDFATLQVGYGCTRVAPTVSMTPGVANVSPDMITIYTVKIINNDGIACGKSTFQLASSGPAGWSIAVSPSSLLIDSGQAGQASLSVRVPSTATAGDYPIAVAIADNFQTIHAGNATASCVVSNVDAGNGGTGEQSTIGTKPYNLRALGRKKKIVLTWSSPGGTITYYQIYRNGVAIGHTTKAKLKYTDRSPTPGVTYTYSVTAVDGAGKESPHSDSASGTAIPPRS